MESNASVPGSRQSNLKKSFNRSLRFLLTACSREEFSKAFPSFTASEQEGLHHLFVQIVSSLHRDVEEEFESIFLETQAGPILDTVEELVEERTLDPLHSKKSNVGEMAQKLSEVQKNEVNHLMGLLEKTEEQKRKIEARVEQLKKEKQDFSGAAKLLRTRITSYGTGHRT
ncbi:embryo defective 3006 [Perilla frutescens var. hirtella]|uniref:Embryo defective 3006 n=1 Tax=Perilla frutescens var. hirtella TaxID=608512 RepID=A0AAD4ISC1_PERFH|nr:embryo defective 3006 [Perilla frutescens var. hirtella]